jgi:hypothetical protein
MIDKHLGLQRRYDTFATRETSSGFFAGLGDYIDYVMSIPQLSSILKTQLDIREAEYDKVKALEKQAVEELGVSKEKLLKIIEKNKIDPKTLSQDMSFIPTNSWRGRDTNLLDHLKMFETGEVTISGFYSDSLQKFMFDIAAALLQLGYKNELKEFIVEPEEYGEYYDAINGPDRTFRFGGNTRGNFIFSETWPKRFEQSRLIEAAREIEPWGAFEALVKFWKTRKEVAAGKVWDLALPDISSDTEFHFDTKDSVDIIFAIEDFKLIQKNTRVNESEIHYLHLEKFRTKIATAHWFLSRSLEDEKGSEPNPRAQTDALQNQIDKAWRREVEVSMKDMKEFMEEYRAEAEEKALLEQGEKWWKVGDKPIYDQKDKTISLGGKKLEVVKNQVALCKPLFSKPIGEWMQVYEINPPLKTKQGERGFYYVCRGLNRKTRQDFGVELFEVGMTRIRIKKELFS